MVPAREASVLYRLTRSGAPPLEVRVTIRAGGSPLRVDMADRNYLLVDEAARTMTMVVPDEEMALVLPFDSDAVGQFRLNTRMRFTRRAADTVATVRCTNWEVALGQTRGSVCVSDDGILLRSAGQDEAGRRTLMEAVSVSYTPAPATEFDAPPAYGRMVAGPNGAVPAPRP